MLPSSHRGGRALERVALLLVAGRLVRERARLDAMTAAQPAHLSDEKPKARRRVKGKRMQEEASP